MAGANNEDQFHVRLPPDDGTWVREYARSLNVSYTAVVKMAVRQMRLKLQSPKNEKR